MAALNIWNNPTAYKLKTFLLTLPSQPQCHPFPWGYHCFWCHVCTCVFSSFFCSLLFELYNMSCRYFCVNICRSASLFWCTAPYNTSWCFGSLLLLLFFFLGPQLCHVGIPWSWARGWIQAAAASLHHSHSNIRSKSQLVAMPDP